MLLVRIVTMTSKNIKVKVTVTVVGVALFGLILPGHPDKHGKAEGQEDELHGWIRVCTRSGQRYETLARNCPKGIFLLEPVLPGCVCMQGTWVLHSTLCDHSPYIFYGETAKERCYQIDFNISMFIYLGDPLNIKQSLTYVAPHSLTVFYEIEPNKTTPAINFHWPSVISIHPKEKHFIQASEHGKNNPVCLSKIEYIPTDEVVKAHIWDSARGPTSYKFVDSCGDMFPGGFDDLIGTDTDFYFRSNVAVPIPATPCSSKCDLGIKTTTNRSSTKSSTLGVAEDKITNSRRRSRRTILNGRQWISRNPKLRRQKRYKMRDTVESTWDGLGFCMKSYWDPILKFEMLTEKEKWCYPDRKDYIFTPKPK